jgi:hypothetical protein
MSMKNKKDGGRGGAGEAAVASERPGQGHLSSFEKKDGGGARRSWEDPAEEVRVKVKQHVPNKRIVIVQEPGGDLAKMRVRDSAFYRHGEVIPARISPDCWYEPTLHRSRPHIGGLVG